MCTDACMLNFTFLVRIALWLWIWYLFDAMNMNFIESMYHNGCTTLERRFKFCNENGVELPKFGGIFFLVKLIDIIHWVKMVNKQQMALAEHRNQWKWKLNSEIYMPISFFVVSNESSTTLFSYTHV